MNEWIVTELGYVQAYPIPDNEILTHHYAKKYYQSPAETNYQKSYSEDETFHRRSKYELIYCALQETRNFDLESFSTALDIGCGEGFLLDFFMAKGMQVLGLEYEPYACTQFNPHILRNVKFGDISTNIHSLVAERKLFDLVFLGNVLEHVPNPEKLLMEVKELLSDHGIAVVVIPNDFSKFQEFILSRKLVRNYYFFSPPEHLNYFNGDNLTSYLNLQGFNVLDMWADFPIEWFLTNPFSNYVTSPHTGKSAHNSRVMIESLINTNPEEALCFWRAMCRIGHGRAITCIVSKNR